MQSRKIRRSSLLCTCFDDEQEIFWQRCCCIILPSTQEVNSHSLWGTPDLLASVGNLSSLSSLPLFFPPNPPFRGGYRRFGTVSFKDATSEVRPSTSCRVRPPDGLVSQAFRWASRWILLVASIPQALKDPSWNRSEDADATYVTHQLVHSVLVHRLVVRR